MEKSKLLSLKNLLSILKCCLLAIAITLGGTVVFAVVLKFVDISVNIIAYVNDAIRILALFIMVLCLKKTNPNKLFLKATFGGLLYGVLTFLIFSALNASFNLNLGFIYDLLFAVISSMIITVILNILSRKNA